MFGDIKKFFADFIENIKNRKVTRFMPLIAAICLIAILIPTLVAVWHVYIREDDTLHSGSLVSVALYGESGALIAESSVDESNLEVSPLVDVFYNLYLYKAPLEAIPEEISEKPNYKVTLEYGVTEISFSCFFTENYQTSYILDEAGAFYSSDETYHARFLALDISDAAYSSATPPTLSTKDGDTIIPNSASWSYKRPDGSSKKVTDILTSVARHTYSASGSMALSFSKQPSFCEVKVTDMLGNLIYNGSLDGVSSITAEVGEQLNFSVVAEWDEKQGCDSFGRMTYNFDMLCKSIASFSVSSSSVAPGGYVVISAYNIDSDTVPTFLPVEDSSDPDNIFSYTASVGASSALDYLSYIDALDLLEDFKPRFLRDGDALRAILPIPYNTPSGNFTFTLSSGAATSTHTLKITELPSAAVVELDKQRDEVTALISKVAIDEVLDLVEELSDKSSDRLLARGDFLSPLANNYTREYSFGDRLSIDGTTLSRFSALGNAYLSSGDGGKSVRSANVGVVLALGHSTHLGSYAVVDHGLGILTWYCNLSDFSVHEGDVLAKGDTLGRSGESLLLGDDGVLILCSIGGTLINPTELLGNKLLYNVN